MEEILASIRRIIADDDATQVAPAANDVAGPVTKAPPAMPAKPPPVTPAKAVPAEAPPKLNNAVNGPTPNAVNNQDDIDALFAALDAASADPPPADPPPPPPSPPAPAADILELTDDMRTEPPPNFRKIDGQPDVVFKEEPETGRAQRSEPDPPPAAKPVMAETKGLRPRDRASDASERPAAEHDDERPALVSAATKAAVDSAFNALAQTVLVQNARTLEDLVREMLRPMLKSWLDDNLPQLVERLVRAEIERVSRGR